MSLLKVRNRSLFFAVIIFILWIIIIVEWKYIEILKENTEIKAPVAQVFPRGSELKYERKESFLATAALETSQLKEKKNCSLDMLGEGNIYEILRKRKRKERFLEKNIRDFWWYARASIKKLESSKIKDSVLRNMAKRYGSLQWRYDQILNEEMWKHWQQKLSEELTTLMAKRLDKLQNPVNCDSARKLVCQVAKACGFGCQIHHVSYCFIMAYATKRTLILDSRNWKYSPQGWNVVFKPISNTCTEIPPATPQFSMNSKVDSVSLPPVDGLSPRPKQLPMAVPRDLADRLLSFHGQPFAWFISQFLKVLMQPSDELSVYITEKKKALGIGKKTGPLVGLHVRRTDKRSEAKYHEVHEYMDHVSDWYDWYEVSHGLQGESFDRNVFIATDEPRVIEDAKYQFPSYKIFSDAGISSLASRTGTRYSTNSLFGLLFDVTMLSECDYIVCTFSSQVCRLAYELMQNHHIDASLKYYSLDDIYYFGGQQDHNVVAIESHKGSSNEVEFLIGDELGIAGNEKNGYSVGVHRKTLKHGQYPSYKVEDRLRIVDFLSYL